MRRIAACILAIWVVVSGLAFVAAALVPRWPSTRELPWSGFTDFALTPAGEVLVYVRDFDRLLRYSPDGRFLGSTPAAGYRAGRGRVATTDDGRIVLEHMGRVKELAPNGEVLGTYSTNDRSVSWMLDDSGSIVRGPPALGDSVEPAASGDLLFGGMDSERRTEFRVSGAVAFKSGRSVIVRRESDGAATKIASPWYLIPIRFPFPAAIPFAVAAGWVAWREIANRVGAGREANRG